MSRSIGFNPGRYQASDETLLASVGLKAEMLDEGFRMQRGGCSFQFSGSSSRKRPVSFQMTRKSVLT
jgi:hypothetical protein